MIFMGDAVECQLSVARKGSALNFIRRRPCAKAKRFSCSCRRRAPRPAELRESITTKTKPLIARKHIGVKLLCVALVLWF